MGLPGVIKKALGGGRGDDEGAEEVDPQGNGAVLDCKACARCVSDFCVRGYCSPGLKTDLIWKLSRQLVRPFVSCVQGAAVSLA